MLHLGFLKGSRETGQTAHDQVEVPLQQDWISGQLEMGQVAQKFLKGDLTIQSCQSGTQTGMNTFARSEMFMDLAREIKEIRRCKMCQKILCLSPEQVSRGETIRKIEQKGRKIHERPDLLRGGKD